MCFLIYIKIIADLFAYAAICFQLEALCCFSTSLVDTIFVTENVQNYFPTQGF